MVLKAELHDRFAQTREVVAPMATLASTMSLMHGP